MTIAYAQVVVGALYIIAGLLYIATRTRFRFRDLAGISGIGMAMWGTTLMLVSLGHVTVPTPLMMIAGSLPPIGAAAFMTATAFAPTVEHRRKTDTHA